jgi:hypothetical protein
MDRAKEKISLSLPEGRETIFRAQPVVNQVPDFRPAQKKRGASGYPRSEVEFEMGSCQQREFILLSAGYHGTG